MKKRRVLIPLDGSEFSRQIVRVVRGFLAHEDVTLVLFRAAIPPTVATGAAPVQDVDVFVGGMPMAGTYFPPHNVDVDAIAQERERYRTELRDALRVEADRLRVDGYTVAIEVRFGDPDQAIIDYVRENDVDLVAMTTHGRSGLGRLVLGSVAERVLRGVGVPVLLMRASEDAERSLTPGELLAKNLGNGGKLNIAVATDGSVFGKQAIALAGDLAGALGADLTLLVVADERKGAVHAQKVMEEACKFVQRLEPRPKAAPLVGYADEEVLHYVTEHPVDLLVIGAFSDRGAGSATAIGATAQRVVQHAPTSVLLTKGRSAQIKRILACAAMDDAIAVDVAAGLARALDAQLEVFHAVPFSSTARTGSPGAGTIPLDDALAQGSRLSAVIQDWTDRLVRQGFPRDTIIIRRGGAPEAILETLHQGAYDLVVVGSQSGPGHFLGSVANAIVRFAEQSVLVVRTRTE